MWVNRHKGHKDSGLRSHPAGKQHVILYSEACPVYIIVHIINITIMASTRKMSFSNHLDQHQKAYKTEVDTFY